VEGCALLDGAAVAEGITLGTTLAGTVPVVGDAGAVLAAGRVGTIQSSGCTNVAPVAASY
jgi:hypothetical protein